MQRPDNATFTDQEISEVAELAAILARDHHDGLCTFAYVAKPILEDLKGLDGNLIISLSIRRARRNELMRIYVDFSARSAELLQFCNLFERAFLPLIERSGKKFRITKELPNEIVIFPAVEPFDQDHAAPLAARS